ncbi:InlB B-repeat-containing protein [Adlercreutzia sp. ZJ138]|uniref:InlB B-repeat-containing protein n=1 Tax=Adlercreutzia sp. ZJ138 TaxID=2709405 RepID=UPI0013EC679D|nr:InlB B-repeat-containing protein [Adlercreutzia sp. ZJ138]
MIARETNKKRNTTFERVLSIVLSLLLVLTCLGPTGTAAIASELTREASSQTDVMFNGYQNRDLEIYNYLHYTNANGEITNSSGSYCITGENTLSERNIIIGNHAVAGNNKTNPLDADIPISLRSLNMAGTMTIKPVGPNNDKTTVITVDVASSLGALVVGDNAKLEIILAENLAIGSITLGQNSALTITDANTGAGTLTVSGDFASQGTVNLNGGTVTANKGISAKSLSLNGVTVDANNQAVTATDALSMANGRVNNASLFGYTGTDTNTQKTLTLSGSNAFSNVTAVGCEADSALKVSIDGIGTIASSDNTTYYNDYAITYMSDDATVEPLESWSVAYRAKLSSASSTDFTDATIQGYHTRTAYTPDTTVPLPGDSPKPGYNLKGWKLSDSENPVKAITAVNGKITLLAVLEPGAVAVKMDLGFGPTSYTNDKDADGNLPERQKTIVSKLDELITLPVPSRFGYQFKGWKITSGSGEKVLSYTGGTEISYKVVMADCKLENEQSVVTMEAQWEADKFDLTLFLGSSVENEGNLKISVDGGTTYITLEELNNTPSVTVADRKITFGSKITYGQSISAYLKEFFKDLPEGTLPVLQDTTPDGKAQTFSGWSSATGAINDATTLCYGEGGMLTPGGKKLTEYQEDLRKNNPAINAVWGVMSYGLTLPDAMPEGWSLTYTGSDGAMKTIGEKSQTGGTIQVQQGSTVTLTTKVASAQNFSLWDFKSSASTEHGNKILPEEQGHNSGNSEFLYTFAMPAAKVTAKYGKGQEIWVDIAKSPITFEENVNHNSRTVNGFWYADLIDGMTPLSRDESKMLSGTKEDGTTALSEGAYFYQWNFTDKFCVTSKNKATKNQLTLVNTLTNGVYFKDVNLEMRDVYVNNANGSLIDNVDCESSIKTHTDYTSEKVEAGLKNVNLADYANIVVNNTNRKTYATTLYFKGANNTVGAIMQDKFRANIDYINSLKLQGIENGTVKLGTAFGNFEYTVFDISVKEYTKENKPNDFKYLFYFANQTGGVVNNAVIKAPSKNVHAGCLTDAGKAVSFTNSTVELFSLCVGRTVKVINSYMRIHENVRLGSIPIRLEKGGKVVIDGNLEMNFHHWADSDTSEKKGITDESQDNLLIVKGTFCDISNRTWQAGTLICNTLVLGRVGGIKGGTVIANQITNQAVGFWKYDPNNHEYSYDPVGNNQTQRSQSNSDNYPFTVYHHKSEQPNTYTFSGGKIYLLGHYKANNKVYDSTVKATDSDNPVAHFMNPLFDAKGDLVESPTVNIDAVKDAVKTSSLKNNECIVLGNSNDYYSQRRSVDISGAEIYAAGNITFYNDTTVSGGTITCNGSFGSKGDLTVTGGSITATTVGNAYNLKTTLKDKTIRWKRTDIQGGTVTADRIGAFEKRVSDAEGPTEMNRPKGTVTIGENATIVDTPKIYHDVYINYIFDSALFNNNGTPANQNTLRFETTWKQEETFAAQTWTNNSLSFTAPHVLDTSGGNGSWTWDSLTGKQVDSISGSGIPQNGSSALDGEKSAYDRIQMKLYAVKGSYDLIFKAGASQITNITCDGEAITKTEDAGETPTATVTAGKIVVLTFADSTMAKDYSVFWYIDGSGFIHSVLPDRSVNGQISFTMPNSDVEIFAANEVELDLDKASYTLLEDGFRTEANAEPERTDSTFHYLGNLVIHQGSIKEDMQYQDIDTVVNAGNNALASEQLIAPRKSNNDIIQTTNRILVDDAFDNSAGGRTVTLRRIYQNGTPTSRGIELEVGAKVKFLVDGAIRTCRIYVPQGSDFAVKGKNNDRNMDAIYPIYNGDALIGHDIAAIGNFTGKAGNITLQDLTILGRQQGLLGALGYSKESSDNTVQYINCRYKSSQVGTGNRGWYNRSYFAYNAGTVIFDGCEITLKISRDWPGSFCDQSKNVTIKGDSKITVMDNGATETDPARPFYLRIKNSLVIDNATLDLSLRVPDDSRTYRVYQGAGSLPQEVKLTNNATLVLEQHARLNKLVIGDSTKSDDTSTVKAGQTGTGYLLCEDIQVNDSATLEAGGIIVSGFYNGENEFQIQTEGQFRNAMAAEKYIYDGKNCPGLVVNGGTVTAKEYITGDVNGKITVKDGTVNAPAIGTTGKLYGYTQYVPRKGEEYIYTYERIPVGATVNITGGTVNVARPAGATEGDVVPYLGGIRTGINVSGGTVNLGEGAVLGITKEQQTALETEASTHGTSAADYSGTLKVTGGAINELSASEKGGSILMPYGIINVSGASTAIQAHNMIAHCGDITIDGATGATCNNTYIGDDRVHDKVAVNVVNQLSAKNLTIQNGSVVYAAYACANVPKGESGRIEVANADGNRAYLYTTDAYGAIGEGECNSSYIDTANDPLGLKKNVYGTKMVDVHYVVQPEDVLLQDDVDKVSNPNLDQASGLPYYTVVASGASDEDKYYYTKDASCSGYKFLGWYEYDPQTQKFKNDTEVDKIDKTNSSTIYLGAKWEKVKVEFELQIEVEESEYDSATMNLVKEGTDGKNLYRFNQKASVAYGDPILSAQGVLLQNYTTNTLGVLEVSYDNRVIQHTDTDIVTPEMADAYVTGGNTSLVLKVTSTQVEKIKVTLDQNKKDKGRPKDAIFNLSLEKDLTGGNTSNQVAVYEPITSTLGDIEQFAVSGEPDGGDGLINPTAPGYTFGGWYTDKGCTEGTKVNSTTTLKVLHDNQTTTLYAKWTPNTYVVQFSAKTLEESQLSDDEPRWVTADITAPDANQDPKHELNYTWVYDTLPNKDSITLLGGGPENIEALPVAWREGYVFKGWFYHSEKNGKDCEVTSESELDQLIIDKLDVTKKYVEGSNTEPALTLYASYSPVEVTYDLNGGVWKGSGFVDNKHKPKYGDPLAGYSVDGSGSTNYDKLGVAQSADGTTYSVHSTTSGYFKNNSDFVTNDYRKTLARKGYTFNGWKEEGDKTSPTVHYGCAPRFNNLNLVADWTPNTYTLNLHVKDENYKKADGTTDGYESAFNTPNPSNAAISNVTVGEAIGPDSTWPDKTQWHAHNPSVTNITDDTKRFMLGATFAALDPGDSTKTSENSIYLKYASAVTNMLNSGTMFDKGDIFFLPDDEKYRKDVEGATASKNLTNFTVPDYPTGSEIDLYSVYRERSLVFIEEYVDGNGVTQSKVMYSSPWNTYEDYPYDELESGYKRDPRSSYSKLTASDGGYALAGWYVDSTIVDSAREYTNNNYTNNIDTWKTNQSANNKYDINVYTAYVAQQSIKQELNANSNPASIGVSTASYTLPGSMQEGELSYMLTNPASSESSSTLKLVSKEDMEEHQYDVNWTDASNAPHTANDTVAITLKLEKGGTSYEVDLARGGPYKLGQRTGSGSSEYQHIGKGWNITLTLHHSKVMTQESQYTFDISYAFTKGDPNTLAQQKLTDKVTVKLTPSLYNVEYQANLPEAKNKLKLIQPQTNHVFTQATDANAYSCTENQAYGSSLLSKEDTLSLEGYDLKEHTLESDTQTTIWSYGDSDSGGSSTASSIKILSLEDVFGSDSTAKKKELKDGKVTVQADYVAKEYKLKKDNTLPNNAWTVAYSAGANDAVAPTVAFENNASEAQVNYHSQVTFTPNANQPAEYITLTYAENEKGDAKAHRLDTCAAEQNGSYVFTMPASEVTISYSNTMDLYLDNGTIELFPDGFKQVANQAYGTEMVTWPGNYRILQDANDNADSHSTNNVLKLNGDLLNRKDIPVQSGSQDANEPRTITLGNLNIASSDSIELINKDASGQIVSTKVNLTQEGNIKAKNILVPAGTNLTLTGGYNASDASQNKTIKLAPVPNRAAIGTTSDNPANGAITLEKVDVSMDLNAPSISSGIGSGNQVSPGETNSYGNVSIANSRITVKEATSASGQYKGAWIGGTSVPSVTMDNTQLCQDATSSNHGARAIDGVAVTLQNCPSIGTSDNPIKEPIHAQKSLEFINCKVYQEYQSQLTDRAMIGTDGCTTTVSNTTLQASFTGNGSTKELFTGQMVIQDAVSDVTINGVQVVEVGNGSIAINAEGVTQTPIAVGGATQDAVTHNHAGLSYLLLEEKQLPDTPPSLTVTSLGEDKTITVQQPAQPVGSTSKNVTVGTLTINDDAKVVLDGNLKVTGATTVAAGQTLTVENANTDAAANYGVTYEAGLTGEGNYEQTGGKLTGNADVVVKGNMTLNNVTANCGTKNLGSNGGSAATTGADGAITPSTASTVTINGGNVTAATIGACGAQNSTFTFVKTESNPQITGNLVQDHYRVAYDTGSLDLDLNGLPTVLRTQTDGAAEPVDPPNGIPADPTGDDKDKFNCWYISNEDGTTRLGLLDTEAVPSGLYGKTKLSANTASQDMSAADSDGTKTLTVHAWVNPTGTALIKSGRVFTSFKSGYTDKQVSVSQRGAWTAQLVSDGANVTGRDYQVTFEKPLPAGTDLTLTVLAEENTDPNTKAAPNAYYHYLVPSGGTTTVKFSDFTKMGTTETTPPVLTDRALGKSEKFLLSADFGELGSNASPAGGSVTFSLIPAENADPYKMGDPVSYTVTSVTPGAITAIDTSVTVNTAPAGEERLKGSKVYLVGTLSKTGDTAGTSAFAVPFDATATLNSAGTDIKGTWVNGNTVAFELGTYESVAAGSHSFSFVGLPEGSYNITWKLCAGKAQSATDAGSGAPGGAGAGTNTPGAAAGATHTTLNIMRDVCSNEVQSALTVPTAAQPMLKVTYPQQSSRVLDSTNPDHLVAFDCTTNAGSTITVTVEKQSTLLGNFQAIEGSSSQTISPTTVSSGSAGDPQLATATANVAIPAAKGTYRVRFSITGTSKNDDDVFYTFIVR